MSGVRPSHDPPNNCGISSVGRASACQALGRQFEPDIPLQILKESRGQYAILDNKEKLMSRTYKDRPYKIRFPEEQWDYKYYHCSKRFSFLAYAGVLTKKKKHVDTVNHWMTTPSWFIREFMNQPQRTRGKQWERKIVKCPFEELIDEDIPNVSRKPHIYYW